MKVLIMEKEKPLADFLRNLLSAGGFDTSVICDEKAGECAAISGAYDLLILDMELPDGSGCQMAHLLRSRRCPTPILMLIAGSTAQLRIRALEAGADYCLPLPFDSGELTACVRALLRRSRKKIQELSFGNTSLDLSSGMLFAGAEKIRLSCREFEVMKLLFQAKEQNVGKETILSRVWGYESNAAENHVEVYVGFLRKKLAAIRSNVRITAIRRLGYHLEIDEG